VKNKVNDEFEVSRTSDAPSLDSSFDSQDILNSDMASAVRFQTDKPGYSFTQVEFFVKQVIATLKHIEVESHKKDTTIYTLEDENGDLQSKVIDLQQTIAVFRVKGDPVVAPDGSFLTESQLNIGVTKIEYETLIAERDNLVAQLGLMTDENAKAWSAEAKLRDYLDNTLMPWIKENIDKQEENKEEKTAVEDTVSAIEVKSTEVLPVAETPINRLEVPVIEIAPAEEVPQSPEATIIVAEATVVEPIQPVEEIPAIEATQDVEDVPQAEVDEWDVAPSIKVVNKIKTLEEKVEAEISKDESSVKIHYEDIKARTKAILLQSPEAENFVAKNPEAKDSLTNQIDIEEEVSSPVKAPIADLLANSPEADGK
jgi:hypothetical protein